MCQTVIMACFYLVHFGTPRQAASISELAAHLSFYCVYRTCLLSSLPIVTYRAGIFVFQRAEDCYGRDGGLRHVNMYRFLLG